MNRRELLAGIAAAAIAGPALATRSFLAPGHVSADPALFVAIAGQLFVPEWLTEISSVPPQWMRE